MARPSREPPRDEGYPNRLNLFGTDQYGVDIFAKMVHGTTIALLVGFVSMGLAGLLVSWLEHWGAISVAGST